MCSATAGGASTEGLDLSKEAVIQGVVRRDGEPLAGAYVRLLDATGEFVAEVPTSATGAYRFFAASGRWTLRTLAPRVRVVDRTVVATLGEVAEVDIETASALVG
jgi:Protein of unknown function (DUF1416)